MAQTTPKRRARLRNFAKPNIAKRTERASAATTSRLLEHRTEGQSEAVGPLRSHSWKMGAKPVREGLHFSETPNMLWCAEGPSATTEYRLVGETPDLPIQQHRNGFCESGRFELHLRPRPSFDMHPSSLATKGQPSPHGGHPQVQTTSAQQIHLTMGRVVGGGRVSKRNATAERGNTDADHTAHENRHESYSTMGGRRL